jgi:hypothetical protein
MRVKIALSVLSVLAVSVACRLVDPPLHASPLNAEFGYVEVRDGAHIFWQTLVIFMSSIRTKNRASLSACDGHEHAQICE